MAVTLFSTQLYFHRVTPVSSLLVRENAAENAGFGWSLASPLASLAASTPDLPMPLRLLYLHRTKNAHLVSLPLTFMPCVLPCPVSVTRTYVVN